MTEQMVKIIGRAYNRSGPFVELDNEFLLKAVYKSKVDMPG